MSDVVFNVAIFLWNLSCKSLNAVPLPIEALRPIRPLMYEGIVPDEPISSTCKEIWVIYDKEFMKANALRPIPSHAQQGTCIIP
jgi:hypothetical protein